MADEDSPDGWHQVEVEHPQRVEAYQRGRDGLVVAIEQGVVHGESYSVTALPENFRDDDRPIRRYGDDGYLGHADTESDAREIAREWMAENPRD